MCWRMFILRREYRTLASNEEATMMLTVPVKKELVAVIKKGADREVSTVAAYIRRLTLRDLQSKGLLGEDFEIVKEVDDSTEEVGA